MKIKLPENKSEITLMQYQKYYELISKDYDEYTFLIRKISLFTGLSFEECEKIPQIDFEFCIKQIDIALEEPAEFQPTFKIDNIEFGFIPNINNITKKEMKHIEAFDSITIAEFVDASEHKKQIESYHKLMAVFFRPITNKDLSGNYKIEPYIGTNEYCEVMKQMPLSIVDGAMFFFINLATELQSYITKYTEAEQVKELERIHTLKNGVGTQQ